MSCRVKLHETTPTTPRSHSSLRSPTVQLVAVEQGTLKDCCPVQTNKRLIGGGYGVDLPFIPGPFVYLVAIIDLGDVYAGGTVTNLNGAIPGDIDVVLSGLPTNGPPPAAAGSAAEAREAALKHPSWNIEEKQAVLSVMNALGSLRGSTANPVLGFIAHYERTLAGLGINPGFF